MKIFKSNRHEDTVTKRQLNTDDISFLEQLQKEMNEQDHFSQADPRYWVIQGSQRVYGTEDGDPCICRPDEDPMTSWEEVRELVDITLKKNYGEDDNYALLKPGDFIAVYIDGEEMDTLFDMDEVAEWLNDHGVDARASSFEDARINYPNTLFLTYEDACEHLRKNFITIQRMLTLML